MTAVKYSSEVAAAIAENRPLVALETAVVTHGLPFPENVETARTVENIIRDEGAVPATVGVFRGQLLLGFERDVLEKLAVEPNLVKVSRRDFSRVLGTSRSGGTTVAGTLTAISQTSIKVFATGGIGGVHRGNSFDVSADLPTLAGTPAVVVCSGAKSILDLPATLEYLETFSVPIAGFRTDDFPAFYARSSGLSVPARVEDEIEAARLAQQHWSLGMKSSLLLVVPPPEQDALDDHLMEKAVEEALAAAKQHEITGQDVTPFLLSRVSNLTRGESLQANLSLLKNNARVAARTAIALNQ